MGHTVGPDLVSTQRCESKSGIDAIIFHTSATAPNSAGGRKFPYPDDDTWSKPEDFDETLKAVLRDVKVDRPLRLQRSWPGARGALETAVRRWPDRRHTGNREAMMGRKSRKKSAQFGNQELREEQ
jgi:hypothetical protein